MLSAQPGNSIVPLVTLKVMLERSNLQKKKKKSILQSNIHI